MVVGCLCGIKGYVIREMPDSHKHCEMCTIRCPWAQSIMGDVLTIQHVARRGVYTGKLRPLKLQAVCLLQSRAVHARPSGGLRAVSHAIVKVQRLHSSWPLRP